MCENYTENGSSPANITFDSAEWPRYYVICSYVALAVYLWQILVMCFGNCLVIVAYAKEKSLQTVYNKCLLGVAVSDLMLAPGLLILEGVKHLWGNNEWARGICLLGCQFMCASVLGSIWSVLLVTLNRFVRIKYPLHHSNYVTETRVTCAMVAISLFICGTLAVITARFTAWYPGERCYPFAIMDSTVTVYYGVPIIAFPIVAITVLYVWIRLIMCKLESRSIAPIDCRYDDDWHKRRVNMLGLIIALLYVSYTLPLFLPYMWFLYFPCTNRWTQAAVLDTSNIFLYLPSCLDPVIYHMGDRNIRNAINKVLLKCRGRNR